MFAGEVALHRLTWQKVWTLPPPSEGTYVKGMAWRPDGKVIAVAYSNSRCHYSVCFCGPDVESYCNHEITSWIYSNHMKWKTLYILSFKNSLLKSHSKCYSWDQCHSFHIQQILSSFFHFSYVVWLLGSHNWFLWSKIICICSITWHHLIHKVTIMWHHGNK